MKNLNANRETVIGRLRNGTGLSLIALSLLAIGLPGAALAQTDPEADAEAEDSSEIVVTGTLIRGIAPAGTNVIGVSSEDVKASGVTTTAQLLQTVPQLGVFNALQFPSASGNTVTVNRPNLRNLPGFTTAGGSTTLVLMDGHRVVGAGVTSTTPDPDVIPPGAIERLEIVPDGGSAIYGSDAIAGVLNFITRSKFDGVMVDGRYGFADDYYQFDTNATAGKDWGDGGIFVSYNYAKHDAIYGRDRDFVRIFPFASTGLTTLACTPGNVRTSTASNVFYGLPFTTATAASRAGQANQCDASDDAAYYPAESRHSVFAGLTQQLSDSLRFDLKAFFTARKMTRTSGPIRQSDITTPATAAGFATHVIGAETSQSVSFLFGDNESTRQNINLRTYGVTPTFTIDLPGDFQLRLLGHYSESRTENRVGDFNQGALTSAIAQGRFNVYDPALSDPASIAAITGVQTFGLADQQMGIVRAIADGSLFDLPGGAVKIAVGAEYNHEKFKTRFGQAVPGFEFSGAPATALRPAVPAPRLTDLTRSVKSAFGELVVPLFGADNAMTMFQELTLSVSGRYDDYSDVGSTFNPKFGLTWKPVEWLKLRGSYGESFNAPSLADAPTADIGTLFVLPAPFFAPSGSLLVANGGRYPAPAPGQTVYVTRGNSPGIGPQTAKTMSFGLDLTPMDGLKLSGTFYQIKLKGVIGLPPGQSALLVYRDFPSKVTLTPSAADLNAVVASSQAFPFGPACHTNATPCSVYAIVDIRKANQGDLNLQGLDGNLDFRRDTGFGSVFLNVNANYELKREQRTDPAVPTFSDILKANATRFRLRSVLGAEVGNLLGQVTWNHTAGYKLDPVVGFVPQSRVGAFNVINLFFKYDVPGEGLGKDLSVTLGIDNVFDQDPPEFRDDLSRVPGAAGFINGATLGRLVQFGISKKF